MGFRRRVEFRKRFESTDDDRRNDLSPWIRSGQGSNAPIIEVGQTVVVVACPINVASGCGRAVLSHGDCSNSFNKSVNVFAHVECAVRSKRWLGSEVRGSVFDWGGMGNGANTRSSRSEKIVLGSRWIDFWDAIAFTGARPPTTVGRTRRGGGNRSFYGRTGHGGIDGGVGSGRTS